MNQSSAPTLEALAKVKRRTIAGFGGPGHDEGRGAGADIVRALGRRVFEADVLTPKGLDDRTESSRVMQRAYALAAEAYGAALCRFSTGGSTQSVQSALLGLAAPGDTVLVAQNAHMAEFNAAVFAGLDLRVVRPIADRERDVEHGIDAATLAAALDAAPGAKAALVVSPTFYGVTSDVAALAAVCHARGVPLIVDAAWAAAYPFCSRLPQNPMAAGADVMVVSVHKTMGALAQGSLLFVGGDLVDRERMVWAFEMLESTSPSVPILASLDATRRAHALHGERLWSRVVGLAAHARRELGAIDGVRVYGRELTDIPGVHDVDATFVVLDVSALGLSGYEADEWLQSRRGVTVVLSDLRHVVASFSLGTSRRSARRLISGVRALARRARSKPERFHAIAADAPRYADLGFELAMPPGAAAAAPFDRVPFADAAGRIAAQLVAIAPPAVPRLVPGQRVTPAIVAFLQASSAAGAFILDPADCGKTSIRVVRE